MWQTLEPAWQASFAEAWAAYCAGTVPIGAIVIDAQGKILSRGRNHIFEPPAGSSRLLSGHPLAHAEINALVGLDYPSIIPSTCILYTSCEPCPLCTGAFYVAGIREVHYACRDAYGGSVEMIGSTPYLRRRAVRIYGPQNPLLETIVMALMVEFELHSDRSDRTALLLELWSATVPQGVALGKTLFETDLLCQSCEQGADAGALYDRLAAFTS